jgi:hypothetical protein
VTVEEIVIIDQVYPADRRAGTARRVHVVLYMAIDADHGASLPRRSPTRMPMFGTRVGTPREPLLKLFSHYSNVVCFSSVFAEISRTAIRSALPPVPQSRWIVDNGNAQELQLSLDAKGERDLSPDSGKLVRRDARKGRTQAMLGSGRHQVRYRPTSLAAAIFRRWCDRHSEIGNR